MQSKIKHVNAYCNGAIKCRYRHCHWPFSVIYLYSINGCKAKSMISRAHQAHVQPWRFRLKILAPCHQHLCHPMGTSGKKATGS